MSKTKVDKAKSSYACQNCVAYDRIDPSSGLCRIRSPRNVIRSDHPFPHSGVFPIVASDDWCIEDFRPLHISTLRDRDKEKI